MDTKTIYDRTYGAVTDTPAFERMADHLWRPWGGYVGQLSWTTRQLIDDIAEHAGLGAATALLDLCCGSGGISRYLAAATGCSVLGVDYSVSAIAEAQGKNGAANRRCTFEQGDARALRQPDGAFDAVVSIDSLAIVPNRGQVLAECARVLAPGGRLVIADAVVTAPPRRDRERLRRLGTYGSLYPETVPTYRRLLASCGFTDIEVHDQTARFIEVNARWVESYRRFEPELRAALGDDTFDGGVGFFGSLRDEGARGALGHVVLRAVRQSG